MENPCFLTDFCKNPNTTQKLDGLPSLDERLPVKRVFKNEYLEDKGGEYVENDDDGKQMEAEEIYTGPFRINCQLNIYNQMSDIFSKWVIPWHLTGFIIIVPFVNL